MERRMIPIVRWGEVRRALDEGAKAYYVDLGNFWDIVVVDPPLICEMMKAGAFDRHDPDIQRHFSRQDAEAFETRYMPNMLKSNLGE